MNLPKLLRNRAYISLIFVMAFFLAGYLLVWQRALAATGQIYLSPASSSIAYGATIKLNLRITPNATVDGVQATINFDASKLKYISLDSSTSAFSAKLQESVGTSSITISRGDLSGGVSTDAEIEAVTFQSLAYSGTAAMTLSNANATSGGSYTNPSISNATITLTAGSCPSGQTGTPPNCTVIPAPPPSSGPGGSTGGTTTPPKTGTPKTGTPKTPPAPAPVVAPTSVQPSVIDLQVGFGYLTLKVKTASNAQVYLQYGLNKNLDQQTVLDASGVDHVISLGSTAILPGTTYYYKVVARASNGALQSTDSQSFHSKGMAVRVLVQDKHHKPLAHKKMTLHSEATTVTTDTKGYATFKDIAPGNHELQYVAGDKTQSRSIDVANNITVVNGAQTAPLQNFSVVYDVDQTSLGSRLIPLVLLVLLAIVGLMVFRRRRGQGGPSGQSLATDSIIIGGSGRSAVTSTTPSISIPVVTPQNESMDSHDDFLKSQSPPQVGSVIAPTAEPTDDPRDGGII